MRGAWQWSGDIGGAPMDEKILVDVDKLREALVQMGILIA